MIRVYGSMITGKGAITFDEDALTFIKTAGIVDFKQQAALNDLVKDLKRTSVWSKLTAVYPFIGGNANAHSYNLIDPEKYRFTWGNLAEHTSLGVVPRTQAHHNNLPVADISSNAGNDLSIHMYVDDKYNTNQTVDVYSTVFSTINLTVYLSSQDRSIRFDCGSANSYLNCLVLSDVDVTGFMSFTSIHNTLSAYRNGIHIGEKTNTPANIQSLTAIFNYDNTTIDNRKQYRFLSWGKGLTSDEIFLLNEVIQKYQVKLNRSVETNEVSDTNADTFINAAQIKDSDQKLAVNYLVYALKSSGLWDKFTTLYPLVGGTYNSCKHNLIDITKHTLSDTDGVIYSKKGIMPGDNVEIGLFNDLFPDYNTNRESSFDVYIQENMACDNKIDIGFSDKSKFALYSNYYTNKYDIYYLSSNNKPITANDRLSKIINTPTNSLISCQSTLNTLSIYKNGIELANESKSPTVLPNEPVYIGENIRTLSLVATRKSNLTDAEFITYGNIIQTYQRILNREVTYKPVFGLDFNSTPILDVSGNNYSVENNNVIIKNGTGDFSTGHLKLEHDLFANLWTKGTFSLSFKFKMTSPSLGALLFGSTRATDTNCPGCIGVNTLGQLFFVYSSNWNVQVLSTVEANIWYKVKLVVDNFRYTYFVNNVILSTGTINGTVASYPVYIGAQTAKTGIGLSANSFQGYLDEFYLYDVAIHP